MTIPLRADMATVIDAAIEAVRPETLLPRRLAWRSGELLLDGRTFAVPVRPTGRIVVVGGGKAGAGMAAAVEAAFPGTHLAGLVSVPEECGRPLEQVEVRETRPPAANLPTPAVVEATREMRGLLAALGRDDLADEMTVGIHGAGIAESAPFVIRTRPREPQE